MRFNFNTEEERRTTEGHGEDENTLRAKRHLLPLWPSVALRLLRVEFLRSAGVSRRLRLVHILFQACYPVTQFAHT
jgi:hypothetical protein